MRNTKLSQVQTYTDDNLNPAKVNVIDAKKDKKFQMIQILLRMIIKELSLISKDEDLEPDWNRKPDSCLVNNYFDNGLKGWQANMDIQPVFDEIRS